MLEFSDTHICNHQHTATEVLLLSFTYGYRVSRLNYHAVSGNFITLTIPYLVVLDTFNVIISCGVDDQPLEQSSDTHDRVYINPYLTKPSFKDNRRVEMAR